MNNDKMDKALKLIGIVGAICALFDAIFGSEESKKIKQLEQRIDELENDKRS